MSLKIGQTNIGVVVRKEGMTPTVSNNTLMFDDDSGITVQESEVIFE